MRSSIPQPRPAEAAYEAEEPPPATVVALRAAFAGLGELPEDALDDEGLLQAAEAWERIRARADAGQLAVLAAFAARRSGRDREFADDEVALALRLTRWSAAGRMELAEALAERLPATFAALRDGRIDQIRARAVADATLNLSDQAARAVEEAVLPKAERQNSSEVRRSARRAAVRADPAAAEKRRRKSEQDRHVAVVPREDAMADLSIFGAAEEVIAAYEQVDRLARAARADGDERTLDQLRADIALDLLAGRRPPGAAGAGAGGGAGGGAGDHPARPRRRAGGVGRVRADPGRDRPPDRRRRHLASAADRPGQRGPSRLWADGVSAAGSPGWACAGPPSGLRVSRVPPPGLQMRPRPPRPVPRRPHLRGQPWPGLPPPPPLQATTRLVTPPRRARQPPLDHPHRPHLHQPTRPPHRPPTASAGSRPTPTAPCGTSATGTRPRPAPLLTWKATASAARARTSPECRRALRSLAGAHAPYSPIHAGAWAHYVRFPETLTFILLSSAMSKAPLLLSVRSLSSATPRPPS
jgi:Domain of unknown function (DUF222)